MGVCLPVLGQGNAGEIVEAESLNMDHLAVIVRALDPETVLVSDLAMAGIENGRDGVSARDCFNNVAEVVEVGMVLEVDAE